MLNGVDIVLVVFIYVEKTVCCLCCGGDGWAAASWDNCNKCIGGGKNGWLSPCSFPVDVKGV